MGSSKVLWATLILVAALALKVSPRPHQPALLIGQMRQFDLQRPFPRARPPAEDFKDQPRSIDNLCAPGLFKIALLHGRDRAIHDDDRSRQAFHHSGNLIDLAFADVGCRTDVAERDKPRLHDCEINRASETDGLLEACFGCTRACLRADVSAWRRFNPRFNDDCTAGLAARRYRA